jgi:hypothetical protein
VRRAVLGLVLVLAACGPEDPVSIGYATVKAHIDGTPAGRFLDVAVVPAERTLLVMTTGSGSCPSVPVSLDVRSSSAVDVGLDGRYTGDCTADAGPTTTLVRLPDEIDVSRVFTVTLREGDLTTALEARTLPALPTGTRPVR